VTVPCFPLFPPWSAAPAGRNARSGQAGRPPPRSRPPPALRPPRPAPRNDRTTPTTCGYNAPDASDLLLPLCPCKNTKASQVSDASTTYEPPCPPVRFRARNRKRADRGAARQTQRGQSTQLGGIRQCSRLHADVETPRGECVPRHRLVPGLVSRLPTDGNPGILLFRSLNPRPAGKSHNGNQ
jgi:hypothetical protein